MLAGRITRLCYYLNENKYDKDLDVCCGSSPVNSMEESSEDSVIFRDWGVPDSLPVSDVQKLNIDDSFEHIDVKPLTPEEENRDGNDVVDVLRDWQ